MPSDTDLQLLEAYLDDALSPGEVERLDRRLNSESELAAALDQMRKDRAARMAVFHANIPSELDANRFTGSVLSSLRRRDRRMKFVYASRIVAGLAACLLLGFAVGWIGRGNAVVAPSQIAAPARAPDTRLVVHSPKPIEAGQFQVAILDENGNVIAVQRFNKLEDARRFTDDVAQYQARRQQVQDGQATLVSDTF